MSCATADELEPPWARFPWIQLGSIGWRMGMGESYQMQWGDYVGLACPTVETAVVYLHRHPPAPHTWKRWIASWLAEIAGVDSEADGDEDESTPWDDLVDTEGLTAEDAAYPVFVRNSLRTGGLMVPWANVRETPYGALRYSARELGWWARWLAAECADRAAYLDAQAPVRPEWITVERAARTGVAELPCAGIEGMVCTLAATGTLPPPWLAGHEPRGSIEYDDSADDRDRWLWWVSDTFEDRGSWQRYLALWPPAPASWGRQFEQDLALP